MENLLKGVEATNSGATTMKSEFSTLSELVSLYSASIK